MFKSIGSATLRTAEKGGIAYGDQPPYPCSLPLQHIEDAADVEHVESILDFTFDSILDMLHDNLPTLNASVTDAKLNKPWKSVGYKDKAPGGDLVLESRPHVGAYNLARVKVTFAKVHPATIFTHMMAQDLAMRRSYSGNLSEYEVLVRNPRMPTEVLEQPGDDDVHLPELAAMGIRDWHIEYNAYYAPPPVACRDMVYLVEKRYVPETNRYYIYGTSIDYAPAANRVSAGRKCVRGYVMFGWEFTIVGDSTKARYVSCMNPNGWTPTFMVGWMKSEIAKEFVHSRALLYKETPRPDVPDMTNANAAVSAISPVRLEKLTKGNGAIRIMQVENSVPSMDAPTLGEASLNPLISNSRTMADAAAAVGRDKQKGSNADNDDEEDEASYVMSQRGDSLHTIGSDSDFDDMASSFAFSRQTTVNANSFTGAHARVQPHCAIVLRAGAMLSMSTEDARVLQDDEEDMLLC